MQIGCIYLTERAPVPTIPSMHGPSPTPKQRKPPLVAPWAIWIFIIGVVSMVGVSAFNTIHRRAALSEPRGESPVPSATREPGPVRIVATLAPLVWVARQLAPADAEVTLLVPPGQGCHGIELVPSQIAATRQADLVLMVGAGLEPQVEQMATSPGQRRIVLASLLRPGEELIEAAHDHDHDHGDAHDHEHPADPHAWLDPVIMLRYIDETSAQLSALQPEAAQDISARAENARRSAREIDALYRERLAPLTTRTIITHHNAWAYLARRYGLEVAAVIQPLHEVEPTPGDVAVAADALRGRGVHAIFIEPQYSRAAADRIAATTGARVFTLDSLGDGDWPAMMKHNLAALVEGLSGEQATASK